MNNILIRPANNPLMDQVTGMRSKINLLNQKIATEEKYDNYSDLKSDGLLETRNDIINTLDDVENTTEVDTLVQNYFTMQKASLKAVRETVKNLMSSAAKASNTKSLQDVFKGQVITGFKDVANALNIKNGQEYIFGGKNRSVQPIDLDTLLSHSNIIDDKVTNSYSNAKESDNVVRIGPNAYTNPNKISVVDEAFQLVIAGCNMLKSATQPEEYYKAIDFLKNGHDRIVSLEAQVNLQINNIATQKDNMLQQQLNAVAARDALFKVSKVDILNEIQEYVQSVKILYYNMMKEKDYSFANFIA